MKLSIVTTLYYSAPYITEFYHRATKAAASYCDDNYEIIFVNDGSPDNSLDLAIELAEQDSHVDVIDLSRNFGHHQAILTGLAHSKGDEVFLIDSDLEEEPEWLADFANEKTKASCDVIFGVQKSRKGGWFEKFSGWFFYKVYDAFTGFDFPKNLITARLMSRRYLNSLLLHDEREIALGGLYYITGYQQKPYYITKHDTSDSTYSFRSKLSLLVNSIASFSSKPLVSIFFLGLIVLSLSILISLYFTINVLLFGAPPSGWTSLIVSVWALGGLIISCIGIVGFYVSKIYSETKQRPKTIIRHIYNGKDNA